MSGVPSSVRQRTFALALLMAAPVHAADLKGTLFRKLQIAIDQASYDGRLRHTELKRRQGDPCLLRFVMHHGTLEDADRPDATADLDLARLAPEDIVLGQRTGDDDDPQRVMHVVYLAQAAEGAALISDGRSKSVPLGFGYAPHFFVTPRYAYGAAARVTGLRDHLERRAAEDLATTWRDVVSACRNTTQPALRK